ncbi:unnamed protein product, partial [Gongylonema pulchrum]|uniref:Uncharacterized protein n=1 Tax=Gongylonema pulchrum TaxID=637853 RepID=A0A183D1N6_9BILA
MILKRLIHFDAVNIDDDVDLRRLQRNVAFRGESEFYVVEVPQEPNTTNEKLCEMDFIKYREKYPEGSAIMPNENRRKRCSSSPRKYDFF